MTEWNKTLIKWGLLIATSPIWLPFLKALWEEINRSLRPDGGVLGRLPGQRDRAEIERLEAEDEDPLVNEPIVRGERSSTPRRGESGARGSGGAGGRRAGGAGFARTDRKRRTGFR